MIVYVLMFIISIGLLYIAEKCEKKVGKILLYIGSMVPFFLVSAIRYDVGTDYLRRYTADFYTILNGNDVNNLEWGFKTILKICLNINHEPYLLFIVTSFIAILLMSVTILLKSKNKIFSIILFFLGGFFFNQLNLVRQYIAIGLIFVGYIFLVKDTKNYKEMLLNYSIFALFNVIAVLMHSSSIVGFILIFMNKKMLSNWKWVLPCSILIFVLNTRLISVLSIFVEKTRFSNYLVGKWIEGDVSILNIILNLILYIGMYYIYSKNKKLNKVTNEMIFLINAQAISLITVALGTAHMQFARIALYFTIFQIISIPLYVYNMPIKDIKDDIEKFLTKIKIKIKNKMLFEKIVEKMQLIVIVFIVVGYMCLFGFTNIKNNDNEVIPYKTIFNKEYKIK